jgi:hypothetical protein
VDTAYAVPNTVAQVPNGIQQNMKLKDRPCSAPLPTTSRAATPPEVVAMDATTAAKRVADTPPESGRGRSPRGCMPPTVSSGTTAELRRIKDDSVARALVDRVRDQENQDEVARLTHALHSAQAEGKAFSRELDLARVQHNDISTDLKSRINSLANEINILKYSNHEDALQNE